MTTIPQRKISETILDYAAPVMDKITQHGASMKTRNDAMMTAITIWNAHVMALPLWDMPEMLAELRATMGAKQTPRDVAGVFAALSERRQKLFADDPRAVGEWSFVPTADGGITFRCDARMP